MWSDAIKLLKISDLTKFLVLNFHAKHQIFNGLNIWLLGTVNKLSKNNRSIDSKKVANKKKGYRINSQSSSFTFLPPQDLSNDYVDLGLYFQDETILPKIAVIRIEILKIDEDSTLELVDDIYYEPQQGLNKFRLRNYFKDSNIYALVGFYWKDDFNSSEYPTYESIKFHPTK